MTMSSFSARPLLIHLPFYSVTRTTQRIPKTTMPKKTSLIKHFLSSLAFFALLLASQRNTIVLARPNANDEMSVEQLIELAESQSARDEEEIIYGLADVVTNPRATLAEDDEQRETAKQISRDTFLALEPEPKIGKGQNGRIAAISDAERRQIWRARHREQRKRNRDHGDSTLREKSGEHNKRQTLRDGESVIQLTSADVVTNPRANTCRGDLFKHKVRVAGCRPKTITNRFCHGSCSSFYIPRLRSKKLRATFQSCAACIPSETDLVQVRLDCPDRDGGESYRTVVRVKKCACRNIVLEGEEKEEGTAMAEGDEQPNPSD